MPHTKQDLIQVFFIVGIFKSLSSCPVGLRWSGVHLLQYEPGERAGHKFTKCDVSP